MSRIFSFLMIYLLITGSGVLAQNSGSESEETNQKENNSEQETAQPEKINQEQANEYPDPNLIPYRTKKALWCMSCPYPQKYGIWPGHPWVLPSFGWNRAAFRKKRSNFF